MQVHGFCLSTLQQIAWLAGRTRRRTLGAAPTDVSGSECIKENVILLIFGIPI
jgi:hypothetical protein